MSFFDEFNDIVPYHIKPAVAENRPFKNDPTRQNYFNHNGRLVAFYKKAETLKEIEQYGVGIYMEYLPIEQISFPIDVKLTSPEEIFPIVEESSKYTNKKITHHAVRIYDASKNQIGYTSLEINPAGDILNQYSTYENHNRTRELVYVSSNSYITNERHSNVDLNGKLSCNEHFTFIKFEKQGLKSVDIAQRNGKVVGAEVTEKELSEDAKEDLEFPNIRNSVNYINRS